MPLWVNNFLSWVKPLRVHVNNGGTWTPVRAIWINNGGTWTRVFASGLFTSMVAGSAPLGLGTAYGYDRYNSFLPDIGSMSDITLIDGRQIVGMYYNDFLGAFTVHISGFSSDPGVGYLQSVVISGFGTFTVGGTYWSGYSYSGGVGDWGWFAAPQPFVNGGGYSIEVYTL